MGSPEIRFLEVTSEEFVSTRFFKAAPQQMAGRFAGMLLVLGCGRCLWDDLARLEAILPAYHLPRDWDRAQKRPGGRRAAGLAVMATNRAGLLYPGPIDHWTGYADLIWHLQQARARMDPNKMHLHSTTPYPKVFWWQIKRSGGTVAMLAAKMGLDLGYTRVILAGCPLDNSGYFYGPPAGSAYFINLAVHALWQAMAPDLEGRVRSLSGFTRQWLGAPDPDWLRSG